MQEKKKEKVFSYNLQHVLIWDMFVVLGLLLNIMHLLSILRLAWFWRGVHISELCQILLLDKYTQIQSIIVCLLLLIIRILVLI